MRLKQTVFAESFVRQLRLSRAMMQQQRYASNTAAR
jgi:hypothetical protein